MARLARFDAKRFMRFAGHQSTLQRTLSLLADPALFGGIPNATMWPDLAVTSKVTRVIRGFVERSDAATAPRYITGYL
jgi:hypothetical protein